MSRWIIVSNRLPFAYDKQTKKLTVSSGGLVTAIIGIQTNDQILWIGSLPDDFPRSLISKKKDKKLRYSSPHISKKLYEDYYNGFCNDVLWPILHYESELVRFNSKLWQSYKQVNQIFANHICKMAKKDDVIWIHDFHLFLVPKMIKKQRPELKIGFFLHVPFPSSEIYRQLPCREEIADSIIYADLVGFHDFSYLRHFASCVYNLLGIHSTLLEIKRSGHVCKLGVYPVSIDTKKFHSLASASKTKSSIKRYHLNRKGRSYILGVDRLDYTKGLLYKLEAYKQLLEDHPEFIGKVQLIQVAVPSRTQVQEYITLRHEVEKLVGEINGKYSTLDYIPIRYIFKSINTHELMALYRSSKVLFITSKRDGMNLVCLEYIAAQNDRNPGAVVLSEFTGAASTLGHALLINPHNIKETSKTLYQALNMPVEEKKLRHKVMFNYLKGYNATDWANSFVSHLINKQTNSLRHVQKLSTSTEISKLQKKIKNKKKVLLLDYDGTLVPIKQRPEQAVLETTTKSILKKIINYKDVEIVIVSGRPINFLQQQLKGLNVSLAGEHGGKFYDYHQQKWRSLVSTNKSDWYHQALNIITTYTKRTPNSFIEKKNVAISWHYRNSPSDFAQFQARKLVIDLETSLHNLPVSVITGKKVVEVKALEANKGYFANWFFERYVDEKDIIIAIGDDRTDEDMFEVLKKKAITIKVGDCTNSLAGYQIEEQSEVLNVLSEVLGN